jgi:hypothetical protein
MRGGGSQRVLQDMQHVPLIVSSGPHRGVIGIGLRLHYSKAARFGVRQLQVHAGIA